MYVEEYSHGGYVNHRTKGDRKLLLQKKELKKLHKEVQNTGLTIAPLRLFITDKGFTKLRIALAKGKILYEMEGVDETIAREAFALASAKLPISTSFVKRSVM